MFRDVPRRAESEKNGLVGKVKPAAICEGAVRTKRKEFRANRFFYLSILLNKSSVGRGGGELRSSIRVSW